MHVRPLGDTSLFCFTKVADRGTDRLTSRDQHMWTVWLKSWTIWTLAENLFWMENWPESQPHRPSLWSYVGEQKHAVMWIVLFLRNCSTFGGKYGWSDFTSLLAGVEIYIALWNFWPYFFFFFSARIIMNFRCILINHVLNIGAGVLLFANWC